MSELLGYSELSVSNDFVFYIIFSVGCGWGIYNARNRTIASRIFENIKNKKIAERFNKGLKNPKGEDQFFLRDFVYPHISSNSITHDSYLCKSYNKGQPWPSKRLGDCYVCGVTACNETGTFYECPSACRPKEHQSWSSC